MALRTNVFVVVLALSLLGNVMVYSATSKEYGTHYLIVRFAHLALGVIAFFLFKQVRYTSWRKISPWFYLVVIVSLVLVLIPFVGTEVGGARRWFDLGPVSVQPAEFAKLAAIFLLSCPVARARPGSGLPLRPKAGSFFGAGTGAGEGGVAVPEVQTDMIFALIGEELGLLGMVAVIGAFGFLAIASFKIALDAPSVMARCLAAGLATM